MASNFSDSLINRSHLNRRKFKSDQDTRVKHTCRKLYETIQKAIPNFSKILIKSASKDTPYIADLPFWKNFICFLKSNVPREKTLEGYVSAMKLLPLIWNGKLSVWPKNILVDARAGLHWLISYLGKNKIIDKKELVSLPARMLETLLPEESKRLISDYKRYVKKHESNCAPTIGFLIRAAVGFVFSTGKTEGYDKQDYESFMKLWKKLGYTSNATTFIVPFYIYCYRTGKLKLIELPKLATTKKLTRLLPKKSNSGLKKYTIKLAERGYSKSHIAVKTRLVTWFLLWLGSWPTNVSLKKVLPFFREMKNFIPVFDLSTGTAKQNLVEFLNLMNAGDSSLKKMKKARGGLWKGYPKIITELVLGYLANSNPHPDYDYYERSLWLRWMLGVLGLDRDDWQKRAINTNMVKNSFRRLADLNVSKRALNFLITELQNFSTYAGDKIKISIKSMSDISRYIDKQLVPPGKTLSIQEKPPNKRPKFSVETSPLATRESQVLLLVRESERPSDRYCNEMVSLEKQKKILVRRCMIMKWLNYTIVGEKISGRIKESDGLREAIKLIRQGSIRIIVVYELSRLARNMTRGLKFAQILKECNIPIWVEQYGRFLDLNNEDDYDYYVQELIRNTRFSATLAQQVHDGQIERLRDRYWCWSTPGFGYRLAKTKGNEKPWRKKYRSKKIAIHEEEAKIIKKIFHDVMTKPVPKIARELETLRVKGKCPPPRTQDRRWNPSYVSRILYNPIVLGTYIVGKRKSLCDGKRATITAPPDEWEVIELPDLRIIEPADWQKAHRALSERRSTKHVSSHLYTYPLQGKYFCGHHNRAMVKRQEGKAIYCPEKYCINHSLNMDKLLTAIAKTIEKEARKRTPVDKLTEEKILVQYKKTQKSLSSIGRKTEYLENTRKEKVFSLLDEQVNVETFNREIEKIQNELQVLKNQRDKLTKKLEKLKQLVKQNDSQANIFKNFYENIRKATYEEQIKLFNLAVRKVIVTERKSTKLVLNW